MKTLILLSHTPNPRAMKRIKLLNENNIELFIIYARRKKNLNFMFTLPKGVESKEIFYNDTSFLLRLFSLLKLMIFSIYSIKAFKPNIIHLTNLDMLICASIYKKFFNKKVKIIYEVADIPEMIITKNENTVTKGIKKIEGKLCKDIYKLILTSPKYYDAYYCNFIEKEKVFFMPNVPSQKVFQSYKKKKSGIFTIGFIGFIRYFDAMQTLINAVKQIPDIKLLFIGDGMDAQSLQVYAESINANNVEFKGKYDYETEIAFLYGQIDLVYSAYDNRSNNSKIALPNRLYEAIVCELPIIVSEGTYLWDLVKAMEIGEAVDPFNVDNIINTITMMRQDNYYIEYVSHCHEIKTQYYLEERNKELIKLYC